MYDVDHDRLQAIRSAFVERGQSIVEWAEENHFRPEMVYAVLAGRHKGLRGEGHHVAVALGLKSRGSESPKQRNDVAK